MKVEFYVEINILMIRETRYILLSTHSEKLATYRQKDTFLPEPCFPGTQISNVQSWGGNSVMSFSLRYLVSIETRMTHIYHT